MANPSYNACLVEAELRARAAYAQLHRHYHDQRHLDECLADLDQVRDLDERSRRILRWSTRFTSRAIATMKSAAPGWR